MWFEHSTAGGVNQVFRAHQTAAFPRIESAISMTNVLEDDPLLEPFKIKDGSNEVRREPGLGVSLDMDAIEKYRGV